MPCVLAKETAVSDLTSALMWPGHRRRSTSKNRAQIAAVQPHRLSSRVAQNYGNEEASSGGLVCGLQRRVYQDHSSAVHSHRVPSRTCQIGSQTLNRIPDRLQAIRRAVKPLMQRTALQDRPPSLHCYAACPHDVPRVGWHGTMQARHMPAVNASAESLHLDNTSQDVAAGQHPLSP